MATEAEILTKVSDLLDAYSGMLSPSGGSKLLTLDRDAGSDAALSRLREGGADRWRYGMLAGDDDFVLQWSTDGSELNFVDRLRIDGATGAVEIAGLALDGASFADTTFTGQSLFDPGSAAAPAIAAVGDVDTGLFFPAADQIAAVTGGVRRWTASSGGTEFAGQIAVSGNQPVINILEADDGASHRLISDGGVLYIQADGTGSVSDSGRLFLTGRVGADLQDLVVNAGASRFQSGGSEIWRTTADGLGIGTSLVEARLHVRATSNSTTNYPVRVENSANSLDVGLGAYGFSNKVGSSQTSDFNFEVGGNLYLDAAAVRLPGGSSFVIEETDSALNALRLVSDTNEGFLQIYVDGTQTIQLRGQGDNYINSGPLGIGTTAPATALHVRRAGGIIRLEDTASGVAATPAMQLYNAEGLLAAFGFLSGSNNDFDVFTNAANIDFWTEGLHRFRLSDAGQFLLGTTVAGASLLVVNDDSIQINIAKTPASAADTGTTGQVAWDSDYVYVCTAADTWKRAALATW